MALQGGGFATRYGPPVERFEEQELPYEVFEILAAIAPDLPPSPGKRVRQTKKKQYQLRLKRVTLQAIDKLCLQEPQRNFKIHGDQLQDHGTGKTLTEFTLFNDLAPEIRAMIWKEALPGVQAVRITADGYNFRDRPTLMTKMNRYCYRGKASYVPSPLLAVNSESRTIVESQYPLVFGAQLGGRPIRFNYKKDILYFECPSAMINFYGGTLPMFTPELQVFGFSHDMSQVHDKVQHVAIGNIKFYKSAVGATLNLFKVLKTVVLGDTKGENHFATNDQILDFITGDKRMTYGWERYQTFKTPDDGNMPLVERLRIDEFNKLVEVKYKQFVRAPRLAPQLVPKESPLLDAMPFRVSDMDLNADGMDPNRTDSIKETTITVHYIPSPSASPMDFMLSPGIRVNF